MPWRHLKRPSSPSQLGILSFEAARTMSRLVSLYKSLSDDETRRLRTDIAASKGVATLTTAGDERRLLYLACAERLGELNACAEAAARLSLRCSDRGLIRFDLVYSDLKLGLIDPTKKLEFGSKNVVRIVEKMEKLAKATAGLHAATESLLHLEISERKIEKWRKTTADSKQFDKTNFELFNQKIDYARKQSERLRDASLWKATYDKAVGLMARIVCVAYVRIGVVFGPVVAGREDHHHQSYSSCLLEDRKFHKRNRKWVSKSGPLANGDGGIIAGGVRFGFDEKVMKGSEVWRMAGPETVGGSGMTSRYANVIVVLERCMVAPETVSDEVRAGLYEILPARMKKRVGAMLSSKDHHDYDDHDRDREMAEMEETMEWLAPVAHDTVAWQAERNMERRTGCFDEGGERVMLVQTLHFSDLEKTEAAIVEVLVRLSRVLRFEKEDRRRRGQQQQQQRRLCLYR